MLSFQFRFVKFNDLFKGNLACTSCESFKIQQILKIDSIEIFWKSLHFIAGHTTSKQVS